MQDILEALSPVDQLITSSGDLERSELVPARTRYLDNGALVLAANWKASRSQ